MDGSVQNFFTFSTFHWTWATILGSTIVQLLCSEIGPFLSIVEIDPNDHPGPPRVGDADVYHTPIICRPIQDPTIRGCARLGLTALLRRRLLARRPAGIPHSAFSRLGKVPLRNTERPYPISVAGGLPLLGLDHLRIGRGRRGPWSAAR
jgi:hypothetical protein